MSNNVIVNNMRKLFSHIIGSQIMDLNISIQICLCVHIQKMYILTYNDVS